MTEQINIEVEETLYKEVNNILEDIGQNVQGIIKMCFKRIEKEKSISFLLSNYCVPETSNIPSVKGDMTKNKATRLFLAKGIRIESEVTFASKNRSAYNYWANPKFYLLKDNWNLILNDWIKRRIYLFKIPKGTFLIEDFKQRGDRPEIDLQIMYNDTTFTDNRSGISFLKFIVDEISY